jgi:predicted lipase
LSKIIEVTISPKGQTKIETRGFSGAECRLASQFVEIALGQRTAEQMTGEFYNAQQANQDLRQSS